jgi:hypothetical protein
MNFPNFLNRKKSSDNHVWKIVGGAALALVAAGLIANYSDIRRYIKIVTM